MCQDSLNKKPSYLRFVILNLFQNLITQKRIAIPKQGYSLIELMMAILFFGIISVSLSAPMTSAMYLTTNNNTVNSANNLAKTYLKDLEESWKIQADYDNGNLVSLSNYNEDGKYTIQVNSQPIETDDESNVTLRRVTITYKDDKDNILCDLYYDYNRPGGI